MNTIISFLEENDENWKICQGTNEHYEPVAKKVGYEFTSNKTKCELNDYLINKIRESLQGSDISNQEFTLIQNHIELNYFSSNKRSHKNSRLFIRLIRYTINQLSSYSNSLESWELARFYLDAYFSISGNSYYLSPYKNQNETIANSIRYLRNHGFKTLIISGKIKLPENDEKCLLESINYRFKKLGYNATTFTLACLSSFYDNKSERYFIKRAPVSTEDYNSNIPWGYILNTCLSNFHQPEENKLKKGMFNDAVELAKHYFSIQRLQTPSQFSDINHKYDTILPAIQKNIVYDQHFSINQISCKHFSKILSGIFSPQRLSAYDINLTIYIDIYKWIASQATYNKPYSFTSGEIFRSLIPKYYKHELNDALSELSFNSGEINKGYLIPDDTSKINYYLKPLIKNESVYTYINPLIFNYGFHNHLVDLCNSKGINNSSMGPITESFVEDLLKMHGLTVIANKKYKIPKLYAKELSISSESRECDFIIETNNTIIFIELKRKHLISESRGGNITTSMIDLSQSLFHALAQTGCHEYILRRDQVIRFEDGTYIKLNNRRVERIALSLFDFYALQDNVFIQQILNSLISATINTEDKYTASKINRYLIEIRNQYNTRIFRKEYFHNNGISFMNCRSFSVPQLMEILANSTDNDSFEKELNRTKFMTTGSKDWYIEYQYMRQISS